jgi:protein SCO1
VDPDRDTPEVLKADLSYFGVDALGLTGTREEIDQVVNQYGATYIMSPPDEDGRYTVAHTTTLYGLDTAGRVRMTFSFDASVDEIAAGVGDLLQAE